MTSAELLVLLEDFYRDKLTLRQRHVAAARAVGHYEFNNTYQYVIAREDVQLGWLRGAIEERRGSLSEVGEPEVRVARGEDALRRLLEEDRDLEQGFFDRWSERVAMVTHARHRSMLGVILGETLEHRRFFDQALAGRADLLGRRPAGAGTGGGVLPVRWVE